MSFLYLLENLRTPFFDAFFGAVTRLGSETLFMLDAILFYWCVSKKWGYCILCVGFFGTLINQFAKIVCRVPRPWVADPNLTIVESARAAATGYSFPSGHSANITGTLGCCARVTKNRWLRAGCFVVIALVCFSRMYLGVHYPADVGFSLAVSAVLVFAAYPFFAGCDARPARVYVLVCVLTLLGVCLVLFTTLHAFPADTDPDNLAEAVKNAWLLTGSGLAMLLGLYLEKRYVNFDVRAPLWAQVVKTAVGLALLLGLRIGLKPVFTALFGTAPFAHGLRYFCMVLFGVAVWPLTFRWFAAGCKKAK